MYGVEPNEASLKAHRESIGLEAVSERCFGGANIDYVLLDDGLTMDRMLGLGWHRKYIRSVHRVLRIETVAEAVLNQPVVSSSVLCSVCYNVVEAKWSRSSSLTPRNPDLVRSFMNSSLHLENFVT